MKTRNSYAFPQIRCFAPRKAHIGNHVPVSKNDNPCCFLQTSDNQPFMQFLQVFCKLLFIKGLSQRKIQGTYFKIQGTYFKIYALYFLRQAMCFFAHPQKYGKITRFSSLTSALLNFQKDCLATHTGTFPPSLHLPTFLPHQLPVFDFLLYFCSTLTGKHSNRLYTTI